MKKQNKLFLHRPSSQVPVTNWSTLKQHRNKQTSADNLIFAWGKWGYVKIIKGVSRVRTNTVMLQQTAKNSDFEIQYRAGIQLPLKRSPASLQSKLVGVRKDIQSSKTRSKIPKDRQLPNGDFLKNARSELSVTLGGKRSWGSRADRVLSGALWDSSLDEQVIEWCVT